MPASPTRKPRRLKLRSLIALAAISGFFGSSAQAKAQVEMQRSALESRVDEMRQVLMDSTVNPEPSDPTAQWYNWGNWNNWNNWPNWGNWGNWFNR